MGQVFWISLTLIAYAYVGYPLLLLAVARFRRRPVQRAAAGAEGDGPGALPAISIIMAARNEGPRLRRKLENLQTLDYPQELMQTIVVSDGSTDDTSEILRAYSPPVIPVILETSGGKALALNAAVQHATGEMLVFLDTRQTVDRGALRALMANLADPQVGAVSGELLLQDASGAPAGDAVGLYWKIEKMVRRLESASGSVVGVTGAIYAMRRKLFQELPAKLILDDVLVPMRVAYTGQRVVFEPGAIARDQVFSERGKEFGRKVRTLTGNYQLLRLAPWILSARNPLLFRFVSHKLMRLLVPILLVVCFVSSALAPGLLYRALLALQVVFYLAALLGKIAPPSKRFRLVAVPTTFVMLNAAAAVALYNFLTDRDEVWA